MYLKQQVLAHLWNNSPFLKRMKKSLPCCKCIFKFLFGVLDGERVGGKFSKKTTSKIKKFQRESLRHKEKIDVFLVTQPSLTSGFHPLKTL